MLYLKVGCGCVAYIKYKELTKYFDFQHEIKAEDLPDYVLEYIDPGDHALLGYKNHRDYAVFTTKRMVLFDKNPLATYKKVHIIPYASISTSAIGFKPGKVEILTSLDSGYQMHINFIHMDHAKKDTLKEIYKLIMKDK